jgi:hypothetical protein
MASYTNIDGAQTNEKTGVPVYGIDKELQAKAAAKWESEGKQMEKDAKTWISAVLTTQNQTFECPGTLQEALKDGVVLCNLVNIIKPGCCKNPSAMAAPFKQMENIGKYLEACTKIGVDSHTSFQTVSLYEDQDMLAVLRQIHALGSKAQQIGYEGPTLGAKLAEETPREFSAETLAAGATSVGLLGKGSHGYATQAGMFDTSRNIDKGVGVGVATAEISKMGLGSSECAKLDTKSISNEIVKAPH